MQSLRNGENYCTGQRSKFSVYIHLFSGIKCILHLKYLNREIYTCMYSYQTDLIFLAAPFPTGAQLTQSCRGTIMHLSMLIPTPPSTGMGGALPGDSMQNFVPRVEHLIWIEFQVFHGQPYKVKSPIILTLKRGDECRI